MRRIVAILFLSLLFGCSSPQIKHLNTQEFIKQAATIEQMNSAYKTTYIGQTDSKIYLEYYTAITSFGKGGTTVYWTELSKLSESQIRYILSLKSPYKKCGSAQKSSITKHK